MTNLWSNVDGSSIFNLNPGVTGTFSSLSGETYASTNSGSVNFLANNVEDADGNAVNTATVDELLSGDLAVGGIRITGRTPSACSVIR